MRFLSQHIAYCYLGLTFVFFLKSLSPCIAQISLGPEIGGYRSVNSGVNIMDSVITDTRKSTEGKSIIGIFVEKKLSRHFSVHTKIQLRSNFVPVLVYNFKEPTTLGPIRKVTSTAGNTLSINLFLQFGIPLWRGATASIYAGPAFGFNFMGKKSPWIPRRGRDQSVSEVINAIDKTIKPFTLALVYGASLEYKRFVVWVSYQEQSAYTDSIHVFEKRFNFKNYWAFTNFSIGYKFPLGKRKE